jgi:hypothetical protein
MKLIKTKPEKDAEPPIAEIVFSRTTFASMPPLPLAKRVSWLRYELPASTAPKSVLAKMWFLVPLLALVQVAFMGGLQQVLFHPVFLFSYSLAVFGAWFLTAIIVAGVSGIFLANPREFLNLFVFPDSLKVREGYLEFCWSKGKQAPLGTPTSGGARELRIPFSWISSVRARDYLYMGAIPTKVLEIELSHVPTNRHEWKRLNDLGRDGTYFFDPKTNRVAEKFRLAGIRLPVGLFGFPTDVQKLVRVMERNCGQQVIDESAHLDRPSSPIENFTVLWLEELNTNSSTDLSRQLPSGTTLQEGSYTINRVLGSGGLSVVYEGLDKTQSPVAVKEIICNFGGTKRSVENNLRQILNEVCILQSLNHPNIVKFRSFFAEGTKLYIVMDLIEGINLRTAIEQQQQTPLAESQLIDFAKQCCSILDYLHTQPSPIIHRDFTPDNLMLAAGTLTLVDFNIAQSATTGSGRTVMGKHCFMAPEQFCGESNISTDLYQLGTTLFFLATGTDPEPLTQCDPRANRSDLSEEFCAVIRKLTERNAAQRFESAKQVLDALVPSSAVFTEVV